MPCYSLAVVQAKLTPQVAAEVLASERALEGLRRFIEQQVGENAAVARNEYAGSYVIRAGTISVVLTTTGIDVRSQYMPRQQLQTLAAGIEAQAQRMAVALATDRTANLLRSRYVVQSDQIAANGARVLRLSI